MSELNIEGVESSAFVLDLGLRSGREDQVEPPAAERPSVLRAREQPELAERVRSQAWAGVQGRAKDFGGVALLLALWELAPRLGWVDRQFFTPVSGILQEGWKLAATGDLFVHVGVSLGRTLAGLLGAIVTAIPLGFLLGGWFPRATRFFRPLLHLLGQVNAFSLFPLFVLFFGIGEVAKFSIIYWSCLWPLLFGTLASVRGIDPLLIKTARSMACGRPTFIREVIWPAALPAILASVRIGAMVSFLMLVAAEMVGADRGLGWLVHNSTINSQMPRLYLAASVTALLGLGMEYGLRALERRLVHWKPSPTVS